MISPHSSSLGIRWRLPLQDGAYASDCGKMGIGTAALQGVNPPHDVGQHTGRHGLIYIDGVGWQS